MPYPPAPWQLSGQLWLTLFRTRADAGPARPPGLYGVALVAYQQPSPLTYSELLVARPATGHRGSVTITDIWVDSPDSRDGGRELWAIPKGLCDFAHETRTAGPVSHTSWSAYSPDGASTAIASARFSDVSRAGPRLPFRASTRQQRDDGEQVIAPMRGRTKSLPAVARWRFAADGPLGWLHDARQLGSVRAADFSMSFG